ncbi:copper resistance D family protein [Geomicrobium sp. JCM 19038]|uniref:copper resistance D family protein n=1 Tax=Geomicrobium sp. JCM 19038 TaxID=1460635 RepID=UPI0005A78EEF|nr:CopD family protein [Geomicrobium sp. JCM 19038]
MTLVIFSNIVIFIALTLWAGLHLSEAIGTKRRPPIKVPSFLAPALGVIVIVFSFIPVGLIVESTSQMFGEPFQVVLSDVLFNFRIGQSFVATVALVIVALIWRYAVRNDNLLAWLQMIPTVGLFIAASWSSHAASLADTGFYLNTLHFLAAAFWAGTLLIVGFFSVKEHDGWESFFNWFTPFAIGVVLVMIGTGIGMMLLITPEYTNSWLMTYGQMQLLKHMLFVPLVLYGFAHGFLMKRRINNGLSDNKVRASMRMESVLLVAIFLVTAGMVEQEPPHEVAQTLYFEEKSELGMYWITDEFWGDDQIVWSSPFQPLYYLQPDCSCLHYSLSTSETARVCGQCQYTYSCSSFVYTLHS